MEGKRSPTLELAKTLDLDVATPPPACTFKIDHWARPASMWVVGEGWRARVCNTCAANVRARARAGAPLELRELGADLEAAPAQGSLFA